MQKYYLSASNKFWLLLLFSYQKTLMKDTILLTYKINLNTFKKKNIKSLKNNKHYFD